jgi:hypothetical protein
VSWYTATTNAQAAWDGALDQYMPVAWDPGEHEYRREHAKAMLTMHRAQYRRSVLLAYRRFCLPMRLGECVPDAVAERLAESWDKGLLAEEWNP